MTTMKMFIEKLSEMIDGVLPNQIVYDLKMLLTKVSKVVRFSFPVQF